MSFNPMKFASRPIRFALVIKIIFCFLAADASLAAADVLLIKSQQPAVAVNAAASTAPGAEQATFARGDSAKPECRQVIVEIDEGYGVSGHVTRSVCRKAL
ncbi:MAG TPA: hypothetical protein VIF61_13970 [Methylocystis sp.]|jgi:hypothetical protein